MNEEFLIYIDRLKQGKEEIIEKTLSPDFIGVEEKYLHFNDEVSVSGKAYLADQHLIIQLKARTFATLPCSVCNQDVKIKIEVLDFRQVEDIEDIKSHVYNFSSALRESILLSVPPFAECEGSCPERKNMSQFLKKPRKTEKEIPSAEGQHFPFANL